MVEHAPYTAMVLAGGQGSRMGGVDKGLQTLQGVTLIEHALQRLRAQTPQAPGALAINANRNLGRYEALGVPVWPDAMPGYAGPLAGFLTGLRHCATDWLLLVPCDTPRFPLDLAARLQAAAQTQDASVAVAAAPQADGRVRAQPVCCLLHTELADSLQAFLDAGERKIDRWTSRQRCVEVAFDRPGDDPHAFFNANTEAELSALARLSPA